MNLRTAEALARLRKRRLVRTLVDVFERRLTPFGRGLAVLLVGSAAFGQNSLRVPVYLSFAFVAAALGIAWIASRWALPTLALRRGPVARTSAGGDVDVDVEVENTSRRVARDVTAVELELPATVRARPGADAPRLARLGPGERGRLRVGLRCDKRGAYTLRGLHAVSAFPLGLWRAYRRSSEETSFLVYPAFRTPEEFPVPEGRNYQPGGFLLSSNVGESAEFMHTREYRAGDNLRHVHWASTARLGSPVVKVYHEEYFVRLALALDTEVAPGASDEAFEAGLSIAAGIADNLSRRDYVIDLFAAGERVYHFQAGRALAHFDHILEILACIERSPRVDWQALAEALVPESPRLTGVVAVLMDWTRERAETVALIESLGVAVRVIVVRKGSTTLAPPPLPPEAFLLLAPGAPLPSVDLTPGVAARARPDVRDGRTAERR